MLKYGVLGLLMLAGIVSPVHAWEDEIFPEGESVSPETLPVSLKENVEIGTKYVKLGDIFANVGDKADIKVLQAPKAGRQITLGAQDLFRIARNNRLDWQPEGSFYFVKITRLGEEVSSAEIEKLVRDSLSGEGVSADSEITFSTKKIALFVPLGEDTELSLSGFSYNPRNGQFSATIKSGTDEADTVRVSGRVFPSVAVPVLSKDIDAGQIITDADITMLAMRKDLVRGRVISTAKDAIGKEARRTMRAGDLITRDDLTERYEVEKGKLITVMFSLKNMTLSAQAKALENGSVGDVIKVVNPASKQVFAATVTGLNSASVQVAQNMIKG